MQQTMVVSSERARDDNPDEIVVATPLDAIMRLETRARIRRVVLAGIYARDRAFAAFLGENYPAVRVERAV